MKFSEVKRFSGTSIQDVVQYLVVMGQGLRDLFTGLYQLDFLENFQSFSWTGSIAAGAEVIIPNALKTTPRFWMVLDVLGAPTLIKGDAAWTVKNVTIKNIASTSTFTGTIVFFK